MRIAAISERVSRSVLAVPFLVLALAACDEQGAMEQTGKAIDETAKESAEMVEEGAQKLEEGVEKVQKSAAE